MTVHHHRLNTPYESWLQTEQVKVVEGTEIADVEALELSPWRRNGTMAAVVNFNLFRQFIDAHLIGLESGRESIPEKHLYEEIVFVVRGNGATSVWTQAGEPKHSFEWSAGSLFAVPLNLWHQHHSLGSESALLLSVTTAPSMINAFHNADFIFNNDFVFRDRFRADSAYFDAEGEAWPTPEGVGSVWEANFVPNLMQLKLFDQSQRGGSAQSAYLQLAENSLVCHIARFPIGTYKKAHRHTQAPGFVGLTLEGAGYSLIWNGSTVWSEGRDQQQLRWRKNSLWTYDSQSWHQHFNTSGTPAAYLAFYLGSRKYPGFGGWIDRWKTYEDAHKGGDNIAYSREDPTTLAMFERELAQVNVPMLDPGTWRVD